MFQVQSEGKAHEVVRKVANSLVCQGSLRAVVLGMTILARGVSALREHDAVERLLVLKEIGMAGKTAVLHRFTAPKRGVASCAIFAQLRMRSNAAQNPVARLRIQGAGAKQATTAVDRESADQDDGEYGSENSASCKAAQTFERHPQNP